MTSIVFNLSFDNNAILSCFLFFLLIDITPVITQIFNPFAELTILRGIPTKEAKEEIKTQPETKISRCSM